MDNWYTGDLKIKGSKKNIINFIEQSFLNFDKVQSSKLKEYNNNLIIPKRYLLLKIEGVAKLTTYEQKVFFNDNYYLNLFDKEILINFKNESDMKKYKSYLKKHNTLDYKLIKKNENTVKVVSLGFAEFKNDINSKNLLEISKKYKIDIKIYAFNREKKINKEIIIEDKMILVDNSYKYKNYTWDCTFPNI